MDTSKRDSAIRDWVASKQLQARLRVGLAFRNLRVHGFISSARFQPTVASYACAIPRLAWKFVSSKSDERVQILHGVDGLVSTGEMLLVLGRPGSGCTTLLKALAGDTNGIIIDDESLINYEGADCLNLLTHSKRPITIFIM